MNKKSSNRKTKRGAPAVIAEPPKPNFKSFNLTDYISYGGLSALKEV